MQTVRPIGGSSPAAKSTSTTTSNTSEVPFRGLTRADTAILAIGIPGAIAIIAGIITFIAKSLAQKPNDWISSVARYAWVTTKIAFWLFVIAGVILLATFIIRRAARFVGSLGQSRRIRRTRPAETPGSATRDTELLDEEPEPQHWDWIKPALIIGVVALIIGVGSAWYFGGKSGEKEVEKKDVATQVAKLTKEVAKLRTAPANAATLTPANPQPTLNPQPAATTAQDIPSAEKLATETPRPKDQPQNEIRREINRSDTATSAFNFSANRCVDATEGDSADDHSDAGEWFFLELHEGCFPQKIIVGENWRVWGIQPATKTEDGWISVWIPDAKRSASKPHSLDEEATRKRADRDVYVQGRGRIRFVRFD